MPKTVAIVGTMDTKGREMKYIKDIVETRGHKTVVIDTGLLGAPSFEPDISRAQVAAAGGKVFEELAAKPTREVSNPTMGEGVAKIASDLASQGRIHGIISLGGTQGTAISTAAMRRETSTGTLKPTRLLSKHCKQLSERTFPLNSEMWISTIPSLPGKWLIP